MELKRSEVMFGMRGVVIVEVIELSSPLDQSLSGNIQLIEKMDYPSGYIPLPWYAGIASAESIVEFRYLLDFRWRHMDLCGGSNSVMTMRW